MRCLARNSKRESDSWPALASRANFFESAGVTRLFDVTLQFEQPDPRLKAGASARVTLEGKEVA